MTILVYATTAQFFERLPQTALGARTVADVVDSLTTSSSDMDEFFRGAYPLPFAFVGSSVSRRCADHARYLFLGGRGFSPESASDLDIVRAEEAFQVWGDKVQRRVIFPDVTVDPTATMIRPPTFDTYAQPFVLSSSVVNSNGRTAVNRGW